MAFKFNPFTSRLDRLQKLATLDARYVKVVGDTMTGTLGLLDVEFATQYLDLVSTWTAGGANSYTGMAVTAPAERSAFWELYADGGAGSWEPWGGFNADHAVDMFTYQGSTFAFMPNGDVNDYITISTTDHQTTINWAGQNGKLTAADGTIDFDNENLTTDGDILSGGQSVVKEEHIPFVELAVAQAF